MRSISCLRESAGVDGRFLTGLKKYPSSVSSTVL